MTVSQKAALSLLISVFLFAGVAVLAYTGLFDLVETRFYAPSLIQSITRETGRDAELVQEFLAELQGRFASSLNEPAVRRSFLPNQSAEDIFERTRIYGTELESIGGLQSVRFVDYAGSRLHFSTYTQDIINRDRLSLAYRNYNEDPQNPPFERIQVSAEEPFKLTFDNATDRIYFSFPFFDSLDVFRGTALFTLSVRAVADRLIGENRIKIGEDMSVITTPQGIVSGSPGGVARDEILSRVSAAWNDGLLAPTPFESQEGTTLALISIKTSQGFFYGRIANENIFSFPAPMKVILLISIFLTIYLIVFLLFNLRQDNMTIVQNRLKALQISLIENYYDHKGDMDWEHWTMELEQRREGVRAEVKRGIRVDQGRRSEENIDALIDKSWDELLAAIGGRRKVEASFDEEKLQRILNRVLEALPQNKSGGVAVSAAIAQPAIQAPPAGDDTDAEEIEELDDLEDLEEAEAVQDTDDSDALEELEEVVEITGDSFTEELETLEELEELPEEPDAESAGVLDEIAEVEPIEKIEAGETLDELTKIPADAELEEIEAAEEIEQLAEMSDEIEALTESEPAEEDESFDEIGELAELPEELEPIEELEEAETDEYADSASADRAEKKSHGLLALAEKMQPDNSEQSRPSDMRVAFGDDDIPYIVESSGFVLVGEGIEDTLDLIEEVNEAAGSEQNDSERDDIENLEVMDLEELEELTEPEEPEEAAEVEELEALEELEDADTADPMAPPPPRLAQNELDKLVSKIEFSTETIPAFGETAASDTALDETVEIVSPFASMFSSLGNLDDMEPPEAEAPDIPDDEKDPLTAADADEGSPVEEAALVEIRDDSSTPLVYEPFQTEENREPEPLPGEGGEIVEEILPLVELPDGEVILEQEDGVNIIRDDVFSPDQETEKNLDTDFRELVDSVISVHKE